MRILVTGGAGFIGSNYVKHIISKNNCTTFNVVVLDKLTYAGSIDNFDEIIGNSNFKFVRGDICDSKLVNDLVSNSDRVINFAAESHVDRSIDNPLLFAQTNSLGPSVLVNACMRQNVKRFIQVSTDEVYGSIESGE